MIFFLVAGARPNFMKIAPIIRTLNSRKGILEAFKKFEQGLQKEGKIPELWDGKASERIVDVLVNVKETL